MNIHEDVICLKGVGQKTREELNNCGIFTLMDLLLYFPRDYEEISEGVDISTCDDGEKISVVASLIELERDFRTKTGRVLTSARFKGEGSLFKAQWFNQPYVKNKLQKGNMYTLTGKVSRYKGQIILQSPTVAFLEGDVNLKSDVKILPKYPLKGSLTQLQIQKLIASVLDNIEIEENLPSKILTEKNYCSLDYAIRKIHFPKNNTELQNAKERLKFQELFSYSLKILTLKEYIKGQQKGIPFKISQELSILKDSLPFELTKAQRRVIREILMDEKSDRPMNRLIQGDVGSGKTIIALIAIFNVVKNGFQAALMAPTEILAQQHYDEAIGIFEGFNIRTALLVGSTTVKEKNTILEELKKGNIDLIIGTHALLEDNVEFSRLGIVVADEQHRFGVAQRNKLFLKGNNIDVLVMTATPIPRTLALYMYADLEVSIIDELPPGRQKIETYYVRDISKNQVYNFALKELDKGRQVYVICPLVEESEQLNLSSVEAHYDDIKSKYFHNVEVAILHGKMPSKQKETIMKDFKAGVIKVLVSTTVVEVGVNVPNATLMIIENAERFGLAQLHQLRGRVGRGSHKSYCILLAKANSEITQRRMEVMQRTNDGFIIAEEDLKIRGGGELLGLRQHGDDGLVLSDVGEDIELLKIANVYARKVMQSSEKEDISIKNYILKNIENTTKYICFN